MGNHSNSIATNSTLNHVYFFLGNTSVTLSDAGEVASTPKQSKQNQSSASSPRSNSADSATVTAASTSSSEMNPLAQEFTPRSQTSVPASPSITPYLYELRETPNKGQGLFAKSHIKRGTLLICEEPLLKIAGNSLHLVWGAYSNLEEGDKAVYDHLHSFTPAHLSSSLENAINRILSDPSLPKSDIATMTRAMSIFNTNAFQATPPGSLAVYPAASRLNHSCVPNVHHSSNPTLGRLTVHAVRDIQPGEELLTTYIGGPASYQPGAQRIELLRSNYGFTCQCPACSDKTGQCDQRRQLMAGIAWGLTQFQQHSTAIHNQPHPFIPTNPAAALRQAEDLIGVLITEGLVTIELTKAYRVASTLAVQVQDLRRALEYAQNEAVVERNCLGDVIDDLWAIGAAAGLWVRKVEEAISGGRVVDMVDGGKPKKGRKWKKNAGKGKGNGDEVGGGDGSGAGNELAD